MAEGDVHDPARIRELITSGEAVDEADAVEILREESDVEFIRRTDRTEWLTEINRVLVNPETDSMARWDLLFRKAVVETGATPDEREFLWHYMLLDLPFGTPRDEAKMRRQESTRRRLTAKMRRSAEQIGDARAGKLERSYRKRLQQLFNAY